MELPAVVVDRLQQRTPGRLAYWRQVRILVEPVDGSPVARDIAENKRLVSTPQQAAKLPGGKDFRDLGRAVEVDRGVGELRRRTDPMQHGSVSRKIGRPG